jgi:hypothetical protein
VTALLAAAVSFTAILAVPAGWILGYRAHARTTATTAETLVRPHDRRPAIDSVVDVVLAAACCEPWWTSAGAVHDPTHCTRKDQTT